MKRIEKDNDVSPAKKGYNGDGICFFSNGINQRIRGDLWTGATGMKGRYAGSQP